MTSSELITALRARYKQPCYVFLEQVRNGTGGSHSRTADAVAMEMWPSDGLHVDGFEIKVSRSDWLRELKEPRKADAVCGFCDRWWVVVADDTIVRSDELPEKWGLMAMREGALLVVVPAPLLWPKPPTREFIAAVLRNAQDVVTPQAQVADALANLTAAVKRIRDDVSSRHHLSKQIFDAAIRLAGRMERLLGKCEEV